MKNIEVPTPGCKSCAKRKARTNPYERIANAAGWLKVIGVPLLLLTIVAAYVAVMAWGAMTGQFETVEVVKTVEETVNPWIWGVASVGLLGALASFMGFIFTLEGIQDKWNDQARKWEQRKRYED